MVLEEQGITSQMFEKVSSVLDTTFAGSFRPMLMKTELTHEIIEGDLLARFSLPPGQYATNHPSGTYENRSIEYGLILYIFRFDNTPFCNEIVSSHILD